MGDLVFSPQKNRDYAIIHVSIVDVRRQEIIRNGAVRVVNGIIAEIYSGGNVPSGIETVDGAGHYIMPGLIDMHVHLVWDGSPDPLAVMQHDGPYTAMVRGIYNARASLAQGVTTIRDVGSVDDVAVDIARAFDSGMLFGPTVIPAGRIIQPTGGHVPAIGYIADSRDELIKAVRYMKARGAALIKVASTGGAYGPEEIGPSVYPQEDLEIIVREAARLGLKVASHSLGQAGIANAVRAGIHTIEHGANIPDDILQQMKEQKTYLIPTVAVYKKLSESSGQIPEIYVEKSKTVVEWHKDTLARAMAMGVPIALGTDAGSPNFGPHPSVCVELKTLVEYGMHPADAVAAATIHAAEALDKADQIGTVESGKKADLLLLRDNPLADVRACTAIRQVIKNGVLL